MKRHMTHSSLAVQSGKRKGLTIYTDKAGKITQKSSDLGYAIGRPSNAGLSLPLPLSLSPSPCLLAHSVGDWGKCSEEGASGASGASGA